MEPKPCDKNKWSQKWTFRPIMDENNDPKCATFNDRGGVRQIGIFQIRLQNWTCEI